MNNQAPLHFSSFFLLYARFNVQTTWKGQKLDAAKGEQSGSRFYWIRGDFKIEYLKEVNGFRFNSLINLY